MKLESWIFTREQNLLANHFQIYSRVQIQFDEK